jgi:hypothetical protein
MSYWNCDSAEKDIVGKTIKAIIIDNENDMILFRMDDSTEYTMIHEQDCCETVRIMWGRSSNLDGLVGKKIIDFSESSKESTHRCDDSNTETIYTFTTDDNTYIIFWHGSSNGYYSESPSFYRTKGIRQIQSNVKLLLDYLTKTSLDISSVDDKNFIDSIRSKCENVDIDEEFETTMFPNLNDYEGTSTIRAFILNLRDKNNWSDETYNYTMGVFE